MKRIAFALIGLAGLTACRPNSTPTSSGGPAPVTAEALYQDVCSGCHGRDGTGNGEFASALLKRPSDLTTISLRNGGVYPRNKILTIIDGYERGAHFSEAMPNFGDGYLGEPIIWDDGSGFGTPVPAQLLALSDYIESIQRQ